MRLFLVLFSMLLLCGTARAQGQPENKGKALLLDFSYGYQFPGGDLKDRFGNNFILGGSFSYITPQSNWILGVEGSYLFGNQVKEDVISPLRTRDGLIISTERSPAEIALRERGLYVGLHAGKLISLLPDNSRSGLRISLGAGLLQHKVRIQDDPLRTVVQLDDEGKKGYDRLSNGAAIHAFLGYQHLGGRGKINFFAGVDFYQGFTQNRRDLNYDTMEAVDEQRNDRLFGFRAGWILPFYLGNAEEIYY